MSYGKRAVGGLRDIAAPFVACAPAGAITRASEDQHALAERNLRSERVIRRRPLNQYPLPLSD
jgi:hypothetical protein